MSTVTLASTSRGLDNISQEDVSTNSSSDDSAAAERIRTKKARRRGRRNAQNIEYRAARVLIGIPTLTEDNLKQWLYVAREVTSDEDVHMDILDYVNNGQHHGYGIKVLNILRIVREKTKEFAHDLSVKDKRRMMLWHGTQTNIVPSILQNGFLPPQSNGQMFGTGIYFADRASKSANYCDPNRKPQTGNIGYMFLCDVVVGNTYNAKNAHNDFTAPPTATSKSGQPLHFDSVKCTGKSIPDMKDCATFKRSLMPKGKTVKNRKYSDCTVFFNEYIVYNPDKVMPMFLVKIEFMPAAYTN